MMYNRAVLGFFGVQRVGKGSAISWAVWGAEGPAVSVWAVSNSVFLGAVKGPVQLEWPHRGASPWVWCLAGQRCHSCPSHFLWQRNLLNFYHFLSFLPILHLTTHSLSWRIFNSINIYSIFPWHQEKLLLQGWWLLLVQEFWFWPCRQLQEVLAGN